MEQKKSKKAKGSMLLYAAAAIVLVSAIVLLVTNVTAFKNAVEQYVSQGYPEDMVSKQLFQTQLLPIIVQAIALYGGLAVALIGIGLINQKSLDSLNLLKTNEICCETVEKADDIYEVTEELDEAIEEATDEETKSI